MLNFSSKTIYGCTLNSQNGTAFDLEIAEETASLTSLVVTVPDQALSLKAIWLAEAGVHSWQRVPPTEQRGRVHTSSTTVVVLPLAKAESYSNLKSTDVEEDVARGSGPGGQHRNRTNSAVRLRHKPSNLEVRICTERSQHRNRALAYSILNARLDQLLQSAKSNAENGSRREITQMTQKTRTWRVKDDLVIDHRTQKKAPLQKVLRGELQLLQ